MAKTREKMDFDAMLSSIRKKEFAPIYFFYGDESFLIDEFIDAIIEYGVDQSMKEFNLDILHGNEVDGKRIVSIASSFPMMADRRVVIVKEVEKVKQTEVLEQYFAHPSETTILLLIADAKPDMRKKPFTLMKKHSVGGECSQLYDDKIPAWIESRSKKKKLTMEPQAIALLHSYVGNSLRELDNELEKLLIYIGDRTSVTANDVKLAVGVSREYNPFELSNMIGEKNITRSLEITERLISSGENIVPILAAITSHFLKLWKLQDGVRLRKNEFELAQIAGVHPFFLKQYLGHLKKYSLHQIETAFVILADADLSAKSSGDPKLILTMAITAIIHSTINEHQEAMMS
jgi:DNA polymerase III subunit delta